jgi:hypothetical protein
MIAQIAGSLPISGENPRVDVDKTDLGFPVGGVSARIKAVKGYELK